MTIFSGREFVSGYSQNCDFQRGFHDKCGQNGHFVDCIYRQYVHTHSHTRIICAQISRQSLNVTFFAANKEILASIHRAVIFDVDFVINGGQDGHSVNRNYRQYTYTFTYTHICAQISYRPKRHFFANKEIWQLLCE